MKPIKQLQIILPTLTTKPLCVALKNVCQGTLPDFWQQKIERRGITALVMVALAFAACATTDKPAASAPAPLENPAAGSATGTPQPAPTQDWAAVSPDKPGCELQSDMTVDVSWPAVPEASGYVVYWSPQRNFQKTKGNSETTSGVSFNSKLRRDEYGAKLPMYYRVAAVKDGVESKLSEACLAQLLPHKGGKFCQICDERAAGYCHLRDIYVCSTHNTFSADDGTNWQCP